MPLLARPVLSSAEAAERPRQIKINPSCLERERIYLASRASSYQTRGEHSDSVQKWAGGRRGEEQRAPGRHQALPSDPSSLPQAHNTGARLCFSPACSRRWTSRKETAGCALLQSPAGQCAHRGAGLSLRGWQPTPTSATSLTCPRSRALPSSWGLPYPAAAENRRIAQCMQCRDSLTGFI